MEVKQASRADSFSWAFTGGAVIKDGTPTDTATVTVIAGTAGTDLIATATAHNAQGDSDPKDSPAVTVTAKVLDPITADIVFDPASVQLPDSTCQCSFTNPQGGAGAPYKVVGGGWGLDNYLGGEQIDHDSGLITGIDTAGTLDVSVVIEDKDGNSSGIGDIAAQLVVKPLPDPHDALITVNPLTASIAAGTVTISYYCEIQGDLSQIKSYTWFIDGKPFTDFSGANGDADIDFSKYKEGTYEIQCKALYGTQGKMLESNKVNFEVTA